MKNLCSSLLLLLLTLLFFIANLSEAAVRCNTVNAKAAACVTYVTGKAARPSTACCNGLKQVAQMAKTVNDKKAICRCLKARVKSIRGAQNRYVRHIPKACNINVGFRVSMNTNCEEIH